MTDLTYLLISSNDGDEEVHAYGPSELANLYSPEQLAELAAGKSVITKAWAGNIMLRAVDMVVAARSVVD